MQITSKRIFVTGGAGFIGAALVRRLADDNEIVVYDSLHRDAISNSGLLRHKNVEFAHSDGSQIRAWRYIDDMIGGLLLALSKPEAIGNSFNIGNPRSTITIYNLALEVIRLSGSSSQIDFQPVNYADIEIRVPNIDKARALLGYEPGIELQEGTLRTMEWYRENPS